MSSSFNCTIICVCKRQKGRILLWRKLSVRLLANDCEHNFSYSFQWMILKPSSIVTNGRQLCVKAGFFIHNRVKLLFQIFAYAYIAISCEHNSYSFQWKILRLSRIVTHSTQLCLKALSFCLSPFLTAPFSNIYLCIYSKFGRIYSPVGVLLLLIEHPQLCAHFYFSVIIVLYLDCLPNKVSTINYFPESNNVIYPRNQFML